MLPRKKQYNRVIQNGNRTRDQWGITGYYGGNGRWQNSGMGNITGTSR